MIKNKDQGFTLVELLVVVAIIGVLASAVVEVVPEAVTRAKLASFACNLATLQSAVDRFFVDTGEYPCALQPTEDAPEIIDFLSFDESCDLPFVGGYIQFEPSMKAQDMGLEQGELTYYVSCYGRVFAISSDIGEEAIAYTQDNVLGDYTVLDIVPDLDI